MVFGQHRLALCPIFKSQLAWRDAGIPAQDYAQETATDDEALAVFFEVKTLRPPLFVVGQSNA